LEALNVINVIALVLTMLYVVVISSFIRGWKALRQFQYQQHQPLKVSIIIAARDEAENIEKTIKDLLAQDYEKAFLEIIFIDDHSTDNTAEIIKAYEAQGITLIQFKESNTLNSYKKKAIETAIGNARGELIITTDADCRMGPNWLKTIVSYYQEGGYKMISSPVVYFEEQSRFERAQSLEFLFLIGMGASTIGNNKPSTCNGANLAYERQAFYEVGGFKGIDDLASGDDELLLHKMAEKYGNKIGFLKNHDAIVYTQAKPTLREFIQQRKRWASKSTRYKNKSIIVLGILVWLFNLSIVLNLLAGIILLLFGSAQAELLQAMANTMDTAKISGGQQLLYLALLQFCIKLMIEFLFLKKVTQFARRPELMQLLPLLNILHIVYLIYIGIAGNSGKYSWKGRMVR
jgi:cellulose synthase/poly-beta-1,6-N-acetylglucosamine synthase-like glycosyltransferase